MKTFTNLPEDPFEESDIFPEQIKRNTRLHTGNSWMKSMLIFMLLSMNLLYLKAQDFIDWTSIVLPQVYNSSVAWGDYDNDGDLDILLTGNTDTSRVSKIYRNDGGDTFTWQTGISLTGVDCGSVAWGDYDNDGDLDILLTGDTGSDCISKIYKNNGDNTFIPQVGISLTGVCCGSAAWGDADNDGYLDILLTGNNGSIDVSEIYKNNGDNTFTKQSQVSLAGVSSSSVSWGDYDNDNDLDILLTGYYLTSKIYKNYGNYVFADQTAISLQGLSNTSSAWGDYNNDGHPDILLTGDPGSGSSWNYSLIYTNIGENNFSEDISFDGVSSGSVAWGDYNNDGYLDVLLTGYYRLDLYVHEPVSKIYKNNGDNSFTAQSVTLTPVDASSVAWGDYDHDGDLDILLTGRSELPYPPVSKIYKNNGSIFNTVPDAPANMSSVISDNDVTLSWDKASDNETPADGLTYNMHLYLNNGDTIMTSMSDIHTGYRRIPAMGNVQHDTSWTIKNLLPGQYIWSVQAIDHAFAGSPFAVTDAFIIPTPPPSASNQEACYGGIIPDLTATGENIKWYSDTELLNLVHTGSSFATGETEPGAYTYYVTQTVNGIESPATTVILTILGPYGEEKICMVTVDLATSKNLVIWEKTPDVGIALYLIYRESPLPEVYNLIGTSPFNELSVFTDTVADPETQSYKYKIKVIDTCGNESEMSHYHKTIFLQYISSDGGINLVWSEYDIEKESLPFMTYTIFRSSDSTSWTPIAYIAAAYNYYTDTDPTALTQRYYYRVGAEFADPCYPTGDLKAGSGPYSHSMSNMEDNRFMAPPENQAPTDIALDNLTIDENLPAQTLIGRFTTTDPDPDDSHIYSFVSGTGDTDNGHFIITGDSLLSGEVFDYETKNSYSIRVSTTDTGDLSFEKQLTITINDVYEPPVNQSPTDISLDNNTINENEPSGSLVGRFTTTDPDVEDTHYYSLVSGTGDTDNSDFNISGDSLLTATIFDYETKNTYNIRISTTDTGDLSFEKQFTILINDVSDPSPLNGSITDSSNISCNGLNDGTATVTASGGVPPYTYLWDDDAPSTTATVTGLAAGKWYHVTVTDQILQLFTDSVILEEPDPINVSKDYSTKICKNGEDGYIYLNTSGGTPLYSFNWLTGETTPEINNLTPGKYHVTITDANGCILEDSTLIDSIVPYQDEEICMVTVNSLNQIIIIWEKTYGKGTAYYNIYRRQSGNTYARIDTVLFDSLTIYTDKSSLPQEQSFYYKITAVDSCSQESGLSPYHKSIHMWTAVGVNGEVTLNWNNYEGYEYFDYEIFRGTDYMQMASVRTITSDAHSWTDPNIPSGRVYYQVAAMKSSPCFPTKFKSDPVFESAMSNIDDNGATGVYNPYMTENLLVYPNPFNESTILTFNNPSGYPYTLYMTDLSGKVIRIVGNINTSSYILKKGDIKEGMYFIELRGPTVYRGKIVLE
jgi:hypothetical protein